MRQRAKAVADRERQEEALSRLELDLVGRDAELQLAKSEVTRAQEAMRVAQAKAKRAEERLLNVHKSVQESKVR